MSWLLVTVSMDDSFPGSYPASPASLDPLLVRQKTAQTLSPRVGNDAAASALQLQVRENPPAAILVETTKLTSHLHPAFGLC
jgi:hypothetical protein